jgi:hypothetical protein
MVEPEAPQPTAPKPGKWFWTNRVLVGRTESIPGEYANVRVEVELHSQGDREAEELLEVASKIVQARLREEWKRRRLDPWGGHQPSLDSFAETLEGGPCP